MTTKYIWRAIWIPVHIPTHFLISVTKQNIFFFSLQNAQGLLWRWFHSDSKRHFWCFPPKPSWLYHRSPSIGRYGNVLSHHGVLLTGKQKGLTNSCFICDSVLCTRHNHTLSPTDGVWLWCTSPGQHSHHHHHHHYRRELQMPLQGVKGIADARFFPPQTSLRI